MVGCMSQLVVKAVKEGDKQVLADAVRIGNYQPGELPESVKEFVHRLLLIVYMGTENSTKSTLDRAKRLAAEIGAQHFSLNIDTIVRAFVSLFESIFPGKKLNYKVHGGTQTENLALQNIQARARMVFAYMLASLMPWVWNRPGFLLPRRQPIAEEYTQTDENDMGMTYEELGIFGQPRKIKMMGPVSMFEILYAKYWQVHLTPREVAVKVKHFVA